MATDTDDSDPSDDTAMEVDVGVINDRDEWEALDRDEQGAVLGEGLDRLKDEDDGEFRRLPDSAKRATVDAIERDADALSDTERAMQAALEQTWTARIFEDLDDVPTVPFECRELTAAEKSKLDEAGRVVMALERGIEDLDVDDADEVHLNDLEGIDIDSEHFQTPDDTETFIVELLGSITTDEGFDAERFRTGDRLRPNTRQLLFLEVFLRYDEESERAVKFRTEQRRS